MLKIPFKAYFSSLSLATGNSNLSSLLKPTVEVKKVEVCTKIKRRSIGGERLLSNHAVVYTGKFGHHWFRSALLKRGSRVKGKGQG